MPDSLEEQARQLNETHGRLWTLTPQAPIWPPVADDAALGGMASHVADYVHAEMTQLWP